MNNRIRKATKDDVSRIAEISVFTKRVNYRSIFHNDKVSFGEIQVLNVANDIFDNMECLNHIWVYDDEFVKGFIHINDKQIKELYVDSFFSDHGIGGELINFAVSSFDVQFLWVLEKNLKAISFYKRYGFYMTDEARIEEGTTEKIVKMERRESESSKIQ